MIRSFLRPLIAACLVLGTGAFGAKADSLEDAVSAWLDDRDEIALPMLASLAAGGSADARLLLAQIEVKDRGPSDFRVKLTPKESQALFRDTSAKPFAKSWLQVEADADNPLAILLSASRKPDPDLKLIQALTEAGERQATDHPTRIMALYGSKADRARLLASDIVLDDLRPYLRYLSQTPEPRGDGLHAIRHMTGATVEPDSDQNLAMAEALALGYGFGSIAQTNPHFNGIADWVLTAPSTQPIGNICNARCPQDTRRCAMGFMALSGGYYEVIRLDSPLERLIPQDVFLSSKRARAMTLRRAAFQKTETWEQMAPREELTQYSQCLADVITEVRATRQ